MMLWTTFRWLNRVLLALASAVIGGMIALIAILLVVGAFGRYSGLFALVWVEEVARGLFIWVAFVGGGVAVARQGHFRLDMLELALSPRGQRIAQLVAHLSMAMFGIGLIATGFVLVEDSIGQYTTALGLPVAVTYCAIPISGLLFLSFALEIALERPSDPSVRAVPGGEGI